METFIKLTGINGDVYVDAGYVMAVEGGAVVDDGQGAIALTAVYTGKHRVHVRETAEEVMGKMGDALKLYE